MKKIMLFALSMAISVISCNAQEKKSDVIILNKTNFIEKVADYKNFDKNGFQYVGDKPAIIDFFATWCGPCKKISPILSELATKYKDEIYIYKVDVDKSREIAEAFGIRSMPTLIFLPTDGSDAQVVNGARSKAEYDEIINELLITE